MVYNLNVIVVTNNYEPNVQAWAARGSHPQHPQQIGKITEKYVQQRRQILQNDSEHWK